MVDSFIGPGSGWYTGPQVEILPGMYLGSEEDGIAFEGKWLAVHGECNHPKAYRIPIMEPEANQEFATDSTLASRDALNAASSFMRALQKQGKPFIVTCRMGIERSPLTFAYFLVRFKYCKNFEEAYKLLISKRPVVESRLHWLPAKRHRNERPTCTQEASRSPSHAV